MRMLTMPSAGDPSNEKLLSDNRDRYVEQSRRTRNGQVSELPKRGITSFIARVMNPPKAAQG